MARRAAAEASDDAPSLHPGDSLHLIAHQEAERQLLRLIAAGRLPHAILLTGAQGIGKATLAYRLARFLLAPAPESDGLFGPPPAPDSFAMSPENPIFRRVSQRAHPDFMVLEEADIKIDDARSVTSFLSLTPAESGWRVVIIDSADAMNRNAANALLKTLEEPPAQAVIILVSHNPGSLLPTIRSRCRTIKLPPLNPADFQRVMLERGPAMSADELGRWAIYSGGSPGVALALIAGKADQIYRDALTLLASPDIGKFHAFADRFARKDAETGWRMLLRLLPWLLMRVVRPDAGAELFDGERRMLAGLHASKPLDLWLDLWEKTGRLLGDADRLHLDRKQTLLTILKTLS